MILKRHHKPKGSDYILAYLMKGSVASLNSYINEHPQGKDAARKDIIDIKYALSHCSNLVRTIIIKMYKQMETFDVWIDDMLGEDYLYYKVHDKSTNYTFESHSYDSNHNIELSDGTNISKLLVDYKMFIMAVIGIMYIKDNIEKFERERENQVMKSKVEAAYN